MHHHYTNGEKKPKPNQSAEAESHSLLPNWYILSGSENWWKELLLAAGPYKRLVGHLHVDGALPYSQHLGGTPAQWKTQGKRRMKRNSAAGRSSGFPLDWNGAEKAGVPLSWCVWFTVLWIALLLKKWLNSMQRQNLYCWYFLEGNASSGSRSFWMLLDLSKFQRERVPWRQRTIQRCTALHCIEIKEALLNCGIQCKCSWRSTPQQRMCSLL